MPKRLQFYTTHAVATFGIQTHANIIPRRRKPKFMSSFNNDSKERERERERERE